MKNIYKDYLFKIKNDIINEINNNILMIDKLENKYQFNNNIKILSNNNILNTYNDIIKVLEKGDNLKIYIEGKIIDIKKFYV